MHIPFRTLSVIGLIAGLVASASAETIFNHGFGGLGEDGLDNVAVDYTSDDSAGVKWNAGPTFGADGSLDANGSDNLFRSAAILSFSPELNKTYSLDASFSGMDMGFEAYSIGFVLHY